LSRDAHLQDVMSLSHQLQCAVGYYATSYADSCKYSVKFQFTMALTSGIGVSIGMWLPPQSDSDHCIFFLCIWYI